MLSGPTSTPMWCLASQEPTRMLDVIVTSRRLAVGVVDDPDENAPR